MMGENKGFSMVELIIIIAIMAILAGALAPTLIKYVNKSRKASDINNANEIAKCTQMALAESEIANYVFSQAMPYSVDTDSLSSSDIFESFIMEHLSSSVKCKYTKNGTSKFRITIFPNINDTGFQVQVHAVGAQVQGQGYELYPEVDASYE